MKQAHYVRLNLLGQRNILSLIILLLGAVIACCGCAVKNLSSCLSEKSCSQNTLSDETLLSNASAGLLDIEKAVLITDNDTSFETKLELIRSASKTIDMAYYIYGNDYSSSVLTSEIIAAAQRGVHVRLLVDYFDSYKNFPFFEMLEQYGNSGAGKLEVRFYGRPSDNIIRDAAYLTLGCEAVGKAGNFPECSREKFESIDRALKEHRQNFGPADPRIPSNFNSGGSGFFLSGLYAKDLEVMAFAILNGSDISFKSSGSAPADSEPAAAEKKNEMAISAARVFWQTRSTNEDAFQRITANLKLGLAFSFYGKTLRPMYEMVSAYLPINRPDSSVEALKDWQYLTQFLHHKLLLVDQRHLVIGGRNVEDAYHMAKNELTPHYVFMDTDLALDLRTQSPALAATFAGLWDFRTMTASLEDVRQHAPFWLLAAVRTAKEKCATYDRSKELEQYKGCVKRSFAASSAPGDSVRRRQQEMLANARIYRERYRPRAGEQRSPSFSVDPQAALYYLENLPFDKSRPPGERTRIYGAKNNEEGESGKHIHSVWRSALRNVCREASQAQPQEVILQSAYFFPPSNLLSELSQMIDGSRDCSNVRITVLTNSAETTDLNVINLAARYSMRAFSEYSAKHRSPKKGAAFRYLEYRKQGDSPDSSSVSLHSKVSVYGPDVFVGSANADIRSYLMDTNNGIMIRNAPRFQKSYLSWVAATEANPLLIEDKTRFIADTSVAELLKHDAGQIRRALGEKLGEAAQTPSPAIAPLTDLFVDMLRMIHSESAKILSGGWRSGQAERKFDQLFKLL
jgi:cardiolipin synthase C